MLFVFALLIFLRAPIHEVTDSAYSMLASESLLRRHTFTLDQYALPRNPPKYWVDYVSNGQLYTIELADGHMYYFFPPAIWCCRRRSSLSSMLLESRPPMWTALTIRKRSND